MANNLQLHKIFPCPPSNNYSQLNYDTEGLWSITYPSEANIISINILEVIKIIDIKVEQVKIVDMTAGCGGNTISFCKYFFDVTAIEKNVERFNILSNNIKQYQSSNYTLICGDSKDYIDGDYNVYFIDPPWGGPNYKKQTNVELYMSDIKLIDFIEMIPLNRLIVLKLPFNYNIKCLNNFNILMKLEMKNINIIYMIR
jgi:hypothetical protein